MPTYFFPSIFVVLWASAFVSAKYGLTDAGPFSYLFTRFVIVAALFVIMAVVMRSAWPDRKTLIPTAIAGCLMHGVYLGGVFFAISIGTPAGISALVVSIQPAITCIIALAVLKEDIRAIQWLGIVLGMIGVLIVVWPRLGGEVPGWGFVSCFVSVAAMSIGTIMQKRYAQDVDLISGNVIHAIAAAVFYGALLLTVETYYLEWTLPVTLSMIWIISMVSVGAVSILMYLIRTGKMAATSSLFFLVPPVSAIMGYFAFGETLGLLGIAGVCTACAGVWLVNRPETG